MAIFNKRINRILMNFKLEGFNEFKEIEFHRILIWIKQIKKLTVLCPRKSESC